MRLTSLLFYFFLNAYRLDKTKKNSLHKINSILFLHNLPAATGGGGDAGGDGLDPLPRVLEVVVAGGADFARPGGQLV